VPRIGGRREKGLVVNLIVKVVIDWQVVARLAGAIGARGFTGHGVKAMVQACEAEGRKHYFLP
jgi:hypothetical protein